MHRRGRTVEFAEYIGKKVAGLSVTNFIYTLGFLAVPVFAYLIILDTQSEILGNVLKVVGGGELPTFPKSSHVHLDTVFVLLNRTLQANDWALGKMVIAQVLIELNVARDQANPPSREIIDRVFSDISRIDAYNKVENYTAALAILDNLSKVIVR